MKDVELPPGLSGYVKAWRTSGRAGVLKVSSRSAAGLTMPSAIGRDVIVTEKALSAFSPKALKSGIIMAIMSQSLGLERNFIILRAAALAMAAPTSVILVNLAFLLRGWTPDFEIGNASLVWLAIILAWWAAEVAVLFVKRILSLKLNEAAFSVLRDATGIIEAAEAMVVGNLDAPTRPWWRRPFRDRPSALEQIERLRDLLLGRTAEGFVGRSGGGEIKPTGGSGGAGGAGSNGRGGGTEGDSGGAGETDGSGETDSRPS
jgi:uncharacterized membrane protein YgcG